MKRKIIRIDESKCNGCGECAQACAEGAIAIVNGKAKLVSESYCDGLGACLGECPQDAIKIEEREAEAFDEKAAMVHVSGLGRKHSHGRRHGHDHGHDHGRHHGHDHGHDHGCKHDHDDEHKHDHAEHHQGCPGAAAMSFERSASKPHSAHKEFGAPLPSQLGNWPIQLMLVPPNAPYLKNADILLAADCTAFSRLDFHDRFLNGRVLFIACPKLDDVSFYTEKLTRILKENAVKSLTVAHMEVPCCSGLTRIAVDALKKSGKAIPVSDVTIGLKGEILAEEEIA